MVRFFFPDVQTAARALQLVMEHARGTADNFSFGPRSASQVFESGLWVDGESSSLADIIERLPGVVSYGE